MINVLINSTTFANGIGGSYDFSFEGELIDMRLTPFEPISESIFRRDLDKNKLAQLMTEGKNDEAMALINAVDKECVRVGALYVLLNELKAISKMENRTDMIICYVPTLLKAELEHGKVKFHLSGDNESSYYQEAELELWAEIMPLLSELYSRLVFKDIASCKANKLVNVENANPSSVLAQGYRVAIYTNQYSLMIKKFAEEKKKLQAAKRNGMEQVAKVVNGQF